MKRAAKQVLIVLLVVMAVIGTGNISAQADYNWKPKKVSIAQSAKKVPLPMKSKIMVRMLLSRWFRFLISVNTAHPAARKIFIFVLP